MHFYLDRGHARDGGAIDEYRQTGLFVDALESLLKAAGQEVIRTPDEIDSFAAQDWTLGQKDPKGLYLACHANVGASHGLVFYGASPVSEKAARHVAKWVTDFRYRTEAVSVSAKGYERTGSTINRIINSDHPISAILLELWTVEGKPSQDALEELAVTVCEALLTLAVP